MAKYSFHGAVYPQDAKLSLDKPKKLGIIAKFQDSAIQLDLVININDSKIQVDLEINRDVIDVGTLNNTVCDVLRSLVAPYCYLRGIGLDVEITYCTKPDGSKEEFILPIQEIIDMESEYKGNPQELFNIMSMNDQLREALENIRLALRATKDLGFFCYRAIEAIMQDFKRGKGDEKKAWRLLQSSLNVEEGYIMGLKKYSDGPRHGKVLGFTSTEAASIITMVKRIIDRYIIYLQNGSKILKESDYPYLKL